MRKRLLFSILLLAIGKVLIAANYYVSTSGNDSNNGTSLSSPFRTVQKAASVVRAGDNVFLRAGTYREEVNITRSGSNGQPITFSSYNNEAVTVTTTDIIGGWSLDKGSIYKTSFNSNIMGRNGMTIFVNGEWMQEAHWSSKGKKVDMLNAKEYSIMKSYTSYSITDQELTIFPDDYWNGACIYVQMNDWNIEPLKIKDFNGNSGEVIFDGNLDYLDKEGWHYLIFNSYNALDAPGEWYFDENSNQLYIWAPNSNNPNTSNVEIKVRKECFYLNGNSYIEFKGIDLRGGDIEMENSNNIVLQGAHIHAPDWDFGPGRSREISSLKINGSNNIIRDNDIEVVCGQFIDLQGANNSIVNNYFHDIGYNNVDGAAVGLNNCKDGNLVSYNTFDRFAHSVINGSGGYHFVIEHNEFSNTCLLTTDVGAIGLGNSSFNNSIIHHNVFKKMANMSCGVYIDAYGADLIVHHNISYDGYYWGMKVNLPANNIYFFNNTVYSPGDITSWSPTTVPNAKGVRFYNNIYGYIHELFFAGGAVLEGNYLSKDGNNFVDATNGDFRLVSGSGAIDAGVEIANITDGFVGNKPDAGALEYGQEMWKYGHDFQNPPNPTYNWYTVPFSNFVVNSGFENDLDHWSITQGSPKAYLANTWNYKDEDLGISGWRSLELKPGDEVEQHVTGLQPNTFYKVTAQARVLREDIQLEWYDVSSGSFSKNHLGNELALGDINNGEWTRYDNIDFGTNNPLFNKIEIAYSRDANLKIEVRLDNLSGPLLVSADLLGGNPSVTWNMFKSYLNDDIIGQHSIYLIFKSDGANNAKVDRIRLLNTRTDEKVTLGIKDFDLSKSIISEDLGSPYWTGEEGLVFKTGNASTQATVFVNKSSGDLNGYVENVSLVQTEISQSAFLEQHIPGTIQAEDFDYGGQGIAYNFISVTDVESSFRQSESVDIQNTNDINGIYHVNKIKSGEWLEYSIGQVESGLYNVELRYAIEKSELGPVVKLDNKPLGSFNTNSTGGFQNWGSTIINNVEIESGSNKILRIEMPDGELNINYIKFDKVGSIGIDPIAEFSTPSGSSVGSAVQFTNTSTNATSYSWDFGDGITSTEVSPVHSYGNAGTYTATLIASNNIGSSTKSLLITIIDVLDPLPGGGDVCTLYGNTDYNGSKEELSVGVHNILLSNNQASSIQVPTGYRVTLYENENQQGGKLILTSDLGSFVSLAFDNGRELNDNVSSVLLEDLRVIAEFSAPSGSSVGSAVQFTNTSTNATSYSWNFGDGITSTEVSPVHSYGNAGTYAATLIASNNIGSSTKSLLISVVDALDPLPGGGDVCTLYGNTDYNGSKEELSVGVHNILLSNNQASSVQVPIGYRVTLYENENQQGGKLILTSDLGSFVSLSFDNGRELNDNVSSVLVENLSVANSSFCILYGDGSFSGEVEQLKVGMHNTLLGNDIASSIKIPQGLQVTLFENTNGQGGKIVFTDDTDAFWNYIFDNGKSINDNVSSVLIENLSISKYDSCSIFDGGGFSGRVEALGVGMYNTLLYDNVASSIQVPSGLQVTLFENINGQGGKIALTGDTDAFWNLTFDNGTVINDRVSSVLVEDISILNQKSGKLFNTNDENLPQLKIWPNPVKDIVHLSFSESSDVVISIYNLLGLQVYHLKLNEVDKFTVNLGDFDDGMYILRVVNSISNEIYTENIIKKSR